MRDRALQILTGETGGDECAGAGSQQPARSKAKAEARRAAERLREADMLSGLRGQRSRSQLDR